MTKFNPASALLISISSIVCVYLVLMHACRRQQPVIVTKVVYKYDTVMHTLHTPQQTHTQYIQTHDTIYTSYTTAQLDTLAVHFYNKTITSRLYADTNLKATITDTIRMNILLGSSFSYTLLKPQAIYTYTTIRHPKEHAQWGIMGSLCFNKQPDALAQAFVITPHKTIYTIGYKPWSHGVVAGMGVAF